MPASRNPPQRPVEGVGERPVERVVVAGPIGSGKSTVGARLAELGAEVIDADEIGHRVLDPGGEAHRAVARRWPRVVTGGSIDRRALAAVVFADPGALRELERLTHPHIAARIEATVAAVGAPVVAVELPLVTDLLGEGWHRMVVLAPEEARLARAVGRGMDPDDARRRMAAQPPPAVWEETADTVIVNDGDLATLHRRVTDWWATHVAGPGDGGSG